MFEKTKEKLSRRKKKNISTTLKASSLSKNIRDIEKLHRKIEREG